MMRRLLVVFCFCLFKCQANPVADPQIDEVSPKNEFNSARQLFGLFNETLLQETLLEFSAPQNFQEKARRAASPTVLTVQTSTERLFTSKPFLGGENIGDKIESAQSEGIPASNKTDFSGQLSPLGQLETADTKSSSRNTGQSLTNEDNITKSILDRNSEELPAEDIEELSDDFPNESTQELDDDIPLEYQTQRHNYPGIIQQLLGFPVTPQKPRPSFSQTTTTSIPTTSTQTRKTTTIFSLGYKPIRPSYAGALSGGDLGPLIPPGTPWPASRPSQSFTQNISLADDVKETTVMPSQKSTTKSPSLIQNITLEDRIKESTTTAATTKSPLEYQSQRPTFAGSPGGISGGHLGVLIPSGTPWPANPPSQTIIIQDTPIQNVTLDDRVKETTASTSEVKPSQTTTTKSPLEYQPQRPTFAGSPGGISGGHLGVLIPSGTPWPANPPGQTIIIQDTPIQNVTLDDRVKETTASTSEVKPSQTTTTKSPLEYKPQRPTFAGSPGGISGGDLGQLVPSGNPWPANPLTKSVIDAYQNKTEFNH